MKALVYHGPGQKAWEEVPDPKIIEPTDVIVRWTRPRSAAPTCTSSRGTSRLSTDGRILGHEGVGTITEIGRR